MSFSQTLRRAGRYLAFLLLRPCFLSTNRWHWLRFYPAVVPDEELLEHWARSEWPDYQTWIDQNDRMDRQRWLQLHRKARANPPGPAITIVTPVFNTPARVFEECILSVRMQTSPYWEWILVDDASQKPETQRVLASPWCRDPRIRLFTTGGTCPRGISAATNLGIDQARGDFIVFLDHDDRLALDAIQALAETLSAEPELDIVYSDRDMLSPANLRYMHLMKPDWSPETLLSGNYIFHLMCYRKCLIRQLGGLRSECDGSQDYDLILRCIERTTRVRHIPKVLYHWRQHSASVALDDSTKTYAFEAGVRALEDALRRRGIRGEVSERQDLWRGHYQVRLPRPREDTITRILLPRDLSGDRYVSRVVGDPENGANRPYLLIRREDVEPLDSETEQELVSWLALKDIGVVTGRTLDGESRNLYAGGILGREGGILRPYHGFSADEAGYMAVTTIVRNLCAPDPFCVAIRREVWQSLGGLSSRYQGAYGLLDFALKAVASGWRILYVPSAVFQCRTDTWAGQFMDQERVTFENRWREWLRQGDPTYNPNLSLYSDRYELALDGED